MGEARNVVITGVTRGLGRAMAFEFARLGHIVYACGRSQQKIKELRTELKHPHRFDVVDVSSDSRVKAWAAKILPEMKIGAPDLILNNAAVINQNAPLWKVSAVEFSKVIDVNVKGTVNIIRCLAPSMIRNKSGVIVNFSSGWGRSTDAEVAPYCASKWAIEGLTSSLAQELPPGVAAVSLNPGVINTEMLQSCFGGSADSHISPENWAKKAVLFLLRISAADNGKQMTVP
jgi:NAD(P)-dependent dehydrogenase (short-subunit alcohol dehydrogenase family)